MDQEGSRAWKGLAARQAVAHSFYRPALLFMLAEAYG
jgi:hypothetical protein